MLNFEEEFDFNLGSFFEASAKQNGNLPLYVTRINNNNNNNNNNNLESLFLKNGGAVFVAPAQVVSSVFPLWNDETLVLMHHRNQHPDENHFEEPFITRALVLNDSAITTNHNNNDNKEHIKNSSSSSFLASAPLEPNFHNFGAHTLSHTLSKEQQQTSSSTNKDSSTNKKDDSNKSSSDKNNNNNDLPENEIESYYPDDELYRRSLSPLQQMRYDCQKSNIKASSRLMMPSLAELRQILIKNTPASEQESVLSKENDNTNFIHRLPHLAVADPMKFHTIVLENIKQQQQIHDASSSSSNNNKNNSGNEDSTTANNNNNNLSLLSLLHALLICRSKDTLCSILMQPAKKQIDSDDHENKNEEKEKEEEQSPPQEKIKFPIQALMKIIEELFVNRRGESSKKKNDNNNNQQSHQQQQQQQIFAWTDIRKISSIHPLDSNNNNNSATEIRAASSAAASTANTLINNNNNNNNNQQQQLIISSPTRNRNLLLASSSSHSFGSPATSLMMLREQTQQQQQNENDEMTATHHHQTSKQHQQVLIKLPFYHAQRVGVHSINCKNCIVDIYTDEKHIELDGTSSTANSTTTTSNQQHPFSSDDDANSNNTALNSLLPPSSLDQQQQQFTTPSTMKKHASSFSPGSNTILTPSKPTTPKAGSIRPVSASSGLLAVGNNNNNKQTTITTTTTTHPNILCDKGSTMLAIASRDGSCSSAPERPPHFSAIVVARGEVKLATSSSSSSTNSDSTTGLNATTTNNNNNNQTTEIKQVILLLLLNELRNIAKQCVAFQDEKEKKIKKEQDEEMKKHSRASLFGAEDTAAEQSKKKDQQDDDGSNKNEDSSSSIFSDKQLFDAAGAIEKQLQDVLLVLEKLCITDNNNNDEESSHAEFATLVAHALRKYLLVSSTRNVYMTSPAGFRIDNLIVKLTKWIAKFALPSSTFLNNNNNNNNNNNVKNSSSEKSLLHNNTGDKKASNRENDDDEEKANNNKQKDGKEIRQDEDGSNTASHATTTTTTTGANDNVSLSTTGRMLVTTSDENNSNNNQNNLITTSQFITKPVTKYEACSSAFLALLFSEALPHVFVQECFDGLLSPLLVHLLPLVLEQQQEQENGNSKQLPSKKITTSSSSSVTTTVANKNVGMVVPSSVADLVALENDVCTSSSSFQTKDQSKQNNTTNETNKDENGNNNYCYNSEFWKFMLDFSVANESLALTNYPSCREGHPLEARLTLPSSKASSSSGAAAGDSSSSANNSASSDPYSSGFVCDECYTGFTAQQVDKLCLPMLHCSICDSDVCVRCMALDITKKRREEEERNHRRKNCLDQKKNNNKKKNDKKPSTNILDLQFPNRINFVNPLLDVDLHRIAVFNKSPTLRDCETSSSASDASNNNKEYLDSARNIFSLFSTPRAPASTHQKIKALRSHVKTKMQWFPIGPSWFLNSPSSSETTFSSAGTNQKINIPNDRLNNLLFYYEIPSICPQQKMYLVHSLTDSYTIGEVENTTSSKQTIGMGVVWKDKQWHWFSTISGMLVRIAPISENQLELCRLANQRAILDETKEMKKHRRMKRKICGERSLVKETDDENEDEKDEDEQFSFKLEEKYENFIRNLPRIYPVISSYTAGLPAPKSSTDDDDEKKKKNKKNDNSDDDDQDDQNKKNTSITTSSVDKLTKPSVVRLCAPFEFNPLQLHPSFIALRMALLNSSSSSSDISSSHLSISNNNQANSISTTSTTTLTPYHFLLYVLRASSIHINSTCERELTAGETFGKVLEPIIKTVSTTLAQINTSSSSASVSSSNLSSSISLKRKLLTQSHIVLLFENLLPLLLLLLRKCSTIEDEAKKEKESAALLFKQQQQDVDPDNYEMMMALQQQAEQEEQEEDDDDDRWRPDPVLVEDLLKISPESLEEEHLELLCGVLGELLTATKKKNASDSDLMNSPSPTSNNNNNNEAVTTEQQTPAKQIHTNNEEESSSSPPAAAASPAAKLRLERNSRTQQLLSSLLSETARNFDSLLSFLWKQCTDSSSSPLRARPTLLTWRIAEENRATIQNLAPNSVTTSREECGVFGSILPPGTWRFSVRLNRPEAPHGMRMGNLYLVGVCEAPMIASVNLSNQHTHGFWLRRKDIFALHDDSPQQNHATTIPGVGGTPHFFCGDTVHMELGPDGVLSFFREPASESSISTKDAVSLRRSAGDRSGENESKRQRIGVRFEGLSPLKRYRPFVFLYNAGVSAVIEGPTSIAQTLAYTSPYKSLRTFVFCSETIAERVLKVLQQHHHHQQQQQATSSSEKKNKSSQLVLVRNLLTLAADTVDSWKTLLQSSTALAKWYFIQLAILVNQSVGIVNVTTIDMTSSEKGTDEKNQREQQNMKILDKIKKTVSFSDNDMVGVALNFLTEVASAHPEFFILTPIPPPTSNNNSSNTNINNNTTKTNKQITTSSSSSSSSLISSFSPEEFEIKSELLKRVKALSALIGETDGFSPRPERDASVVHGTMHLQVEASRCLDREVAYEIYRTVSQTFTDYEVFRDFFKGPLKCAKCEEEFEGVSSSTSTKSSSIALVKTGKQQEFCCKHELPKYACDSWLWNRFNITKNTLSDTWIGPESGGSLSFELQIPDLVDDENNNKTEEKEKSSSSSSSLPVECSSLKFGRFAAKCVEGVREGDSIRLKIEILVEVESELEKEKKRRRKLNKENKDNNKKKNSSEVVASWDSDKNDDDENQQQQNKNSNSNEPWPCPQCTYINNPDVRACEMCLHVPDERLPNNNNAAAAASPTKNRKKKNKRKARRSSLDLGSLDDDAVEEYLLRFHEQGNDEEENSDDDDNDNSSNDDSDDETTSTSSSTNNDSDDNNDNDDDEEEEAEEEGPPPGHYSCSICTFFNPNRRLTCEMCGTKRQDDEPEGKITLRCQKRGHLHHALPSDAFSILPLTCPSCKESVEWSILARDSNSKNARNSLTAFKRVASRQAISEAKKHATVELRLTILKNGTVMEGSMQVGGQPHQVRLSRATERPQDWPVVMKKYILGSVAAMTSSNSEIVAAVNACLKEGTECVTNPIIYTNRLRADASSLRRVSLDLLRSVFSRVSFVPLDENNNKTTPSTSIFKVSDDVHQNASSSASSLQKQLNDEITDLLLHAGDLDDKLASRLICLVDPASLEKALVSCLLGLDASPYHNRRLSNILARVYEARVQAAQAELEKDDDENNDNNSKMMTATSTTSFTRNQSSTKSNPQQQQDLPEQEQELPENNKPHRDSNWKELLTNESFTKLSQLSVCDPLAAALEAHAAVQKFQLLMTKSESSENGKKKNKKSTTTTTISSKRTVPKQLQDLLTPEKTTHRLRLQIAMMEYNEVFKVEKTPLFYLLKYFEALTDQQQYEEMLDRRDEERKKKKQKSEKERETNGDTSKNNDDDIDDDEEEDDITEPKRFYIDPIPNQNVTKGLRIELGDGDPTVLRFGKAIGPQIPAAPIPPSQNLMLESLGELKKKYSGKFYFECTCSDPSNCPGAFGVGDSVFVKDHTSTHVGGVRTSIGHNFKGEISTGGVPNPYPIRNAASRTSLQIFPTTVLGCIVDTRRKIIVFSINGVEGDSIPIPPQWTAPFYPVFSTSRDCHMHVNFENFRHCPPDAQSILPPSSSTKNNAAAAATSSSEDQQQEQQQSKKTFTLKRENDNDDDDDDAHQQHDDDDNDEEDESNNNSKKILLVDNCTEVAEKMARLVDGLMARNFDSETLTTKLFDDESIARKILDICKNQLAEHWEQLPSELTLEDDTADDNVEQHKTKQVEQKEEDPDLNNNILKKYNLFFQYIKLAVNVSSLLIRTRPSAYQLSNRHKRFYLTIGRQLLLAVDQLTEVESVLRTIGNRSRGKVIDVDIKLEDAVQSGFFKPIYNTLKNAPNSQWLLQDPARFPKFDRATDAGGPAREAWSQAAQNVMQSIGTDILVPATYASASWLAPASSRHQNHQQQQRTLPLRRNSSSTTGTSRVSSPVSPHSICGSTGTQHHQFPRVENTNSTSTAAAAATSSAVAAVQDVIMEDEAMSLNRVYVPNLFSTANSSSSKLSREEREKHLEFFGKMMGSSYINKGSISIPIPMSKMIFMYLANEPIKLRDYEVDHGKVLYPKQNNNNNNNNNDLTPPSQQKQQKEKDQEDLAKQQQRKRRRNKNSDSSNNKEYDLSVISKLRLKLNEDDARKELPANATTKDIIEYCCVHQYDEELSYIKKGFCSVCPPDAPVTSFALRRRIMGEPFTAENTLRHLDLKPLPPSLRDLFVDIITNDFDEDQRSKLFQFGCGQAVIPLPDKKKLTIADSGDSLCRASTCAYQMSIPRILVRAELRKRILSSLSAGIGGFGNI